MRCLRILEACFAHVSVLGRQFGLPCLDWRKIENDLTSMMKKAMGMKRKGNLIDAALIAGYVLTSNHDYTNPSMPYRNAPIVIEDGVP